MKKIWIMLCVICLIPFGSVKAEELAMNAKSAILIDAKTGEILFEKNSHEKIAPASMTKMMSMLVIVEAIEDGVLNWNDTVTVSENASSMGGSQILLETGEQMKVKDLFKGVAVASGNDAVVALAEATYGTVDEFVKKMNEKTLELNLKDTNFKNPHGLDDANHYSSAHDMAMIAKELVKHKKVLEFTSIYEDYLRKGTNREFWLVNTNKLVRFYNGVDGLKTGYTKEAGYCLTATASKNDMRLIAVAMGEPTSALRNSEISSMLDYGFAQYKSTIIINQNKTIKEVNVEKAKTKKVEIIPVDDVSILTKKTDKIGNITYSVKLDKVVAPIKKGNIVGKLLVKEDGKKIKEVNLTVKKDIEKANFIELYLRYISDIISGNISFN